MRLKWRLMLLFLAVGALVSVVFAVAAYQSLRLNMMEGADARLQTAAHAIKELVPPDYHEAITGPDSVDEDTFTQGMEQLSRYADSTGLAYVYTYMRFNDRVVTTASSATSQEWEQGTHDVFFQHYDTAPPEVYNAFADGEKRYLTYEDSYGAFRSIFLPVDTGDGRYFVIGADLDLEFLESELQQLMLLSAAIGTGVFLLTLLVAPLAARPLAKPLARLDALTNRLSTNSFQLSADDETMLGAIARRRDELGTVAGTQLAMVHRLQSFLQELEREVAKRERTEGELATARAIQLGMLPRMNLSPAVASRCELDARMIPAHEVGGDLYDYFMLDDHRILIVVGDVAGKGPGAALFMAITRTLIKAHARNSAIESPAKLIEVVNRELALDNPQELFITLMIGVLDIRNGDFVYADGGHDAPLILRANGGVEDVTKVAGTALGVLPDITYRDGHLHLAPGDMLILFTDGVTEARGPTEELFTRLRLQKSLGHHETGGITAKVVVGRILSALDDFSEGSEQADDITLLAISRRDETQTG